MTTTIQAARRRAFAVSLAAVLFATGTQHAAGHEGGDGTFHVPESPQNLRVTGIAGTTHNAVVVSWDAGHSHPRTPFALRGFTVGVIPVGVSPVGVSPVGVSPSPVRVTRYPVLPPECGDGRLTETPPLGNFISAGGATSYTAIVAGLRLETAHSVTVTALYGRACTAATTATIAIFGTEIPDPVTPDPETPDPEAPDCTYEHRIAGIPGSTANTYTARILIGSEESKATVKIRAYQADNGAPIDVLDEGGSAVGATTSLAPAHSVKRFRLEDARGWHTAVIEHPTARAMRRATVAMMLRGPDVGVQIVPVQGIEDCTPAATTTE